MESFDFSKTSQSDEFKNSVFEFTAPNDGKISHKKSLRKRMLFKNGLNIVRPLSDTQISTNHNITIRNEAQTSFSLSHWISEIITTSGTSLNHYDQSREIKCEPLLENTFFFAETTSIKSNISIAENSVELGHQEIKISTSQNLSLPIDLPLVQSFEKTHISNDDIQNVPEVLEVTKTVETSSSICISKLKASTPRRSICTNDAVYDLIRQHRLSWWSDDTVPTFKFQSVLNRDNFCISRVSQRHLRKTRTEFKSVSFDYLHGRKCRVKKAEHWRTVALPSDSDSAPDSDSERIMKPKEKKKISWLNKFSDESELDDSGSSLDGSFRRHDSDSSDSCSEPSEFSTTNCNRSAPPTSSRIFEDTPAEFETMFQKKKGTQFWNPVLLKHLDRNFTENLGFVSVMLQTLQCLCQYGEDVHFETSLY